MAGTILRLGWTDPLTDVFGAHPQLGAVIDLNDDVTFMLVTPGGLELPPPPRTLALAGNVRTQGERATRAIYHQNRRVTAQVMLGQMGSYADLVSNIRALVAWLDAPPAVPFTVMYQPIGASSPVYLDVVGAAHDIPEDEGQWLRLQLETIEIVFIARPGLRGDRVTLQNLAVNPGFEAGSGPGVLAFADTFANVNAYTVVSGSAPSLNPANGYPDIVATDAPLRYYRLDETSGTTAYDVGGAGQNGAYVGAPTLGVAGAISGDTDTAITLNGSSQYVNLPTTGLPTGASPFTVEAWIKVAAYPTTNVRSVAFIGAIGASAAAVLALNTSGQVYVFLWTGVSTSPSSAISLSVWHHVAMTYDGTTLSCYLDGTLVASASATAALTYGTGAAQIGAANGSATYTDFPGSVDEVAIYAAALSATRIAAHYSAGHSGPSGTVTSTMNVPAGTTLAFGSPAWGAINQWQVRFRWASGATLQMKLHAPDSSNQLYIQVSATSLRLYQDIAGTLTQLATTSDFLTPGAWYWAQATQFPSPPGDATVVQATLYGDNEGAVGAQLWSVGPVGATFGVPISGAPQLRTSGAAVTVGGNYPNVHTVSLFGPGGWTFQPITTGATATAPCAGAWEQAAANTYAGGPVTSYGAAQIDLAPAGTVDACWRAYAGGAPTGTSAIPVAASGNVFGLAAMVHSVGLSANALLRLSATEYDSNGNTLRTTIIQTLTGNQAAWTALGGTLATGANAAYLDLTLRVSDTTTPGESANATVWFDNTQVWNQTTTGQTTMPYCELRFPQAPAQLMVSGLLGDLPAPSLLAFGAFLANWPIGALLTFAVGRRGQTQTTTQLVGPSYGWYDATRLPPISTPTLDAGSYGGFYISAAIGGGWNPRAFSFHPSDAPGTYHLLCRFLAQQSVGNLPNISVRALMQTLANPWYGLANQTDQLAAFYGGYLYPLTQSDVWTVVDSGQIAIPAFNLGASADPTQNYLTPRTQWLDTTSGGSTAQCNWQMLLPVDGSLLLGTLNNPNNALFALTNQWLWGYFDGLGASLGLPTSWTYSVEAAPLPNAAHSSGGPGSQTTGVININSGADPYLTLDPTLQINGAGGVNQFAAYIADGTATELPFYAELQYSPLYLYPR